MAYSILLTSLCRSSKDEPVRYYGAKIGNKQFYCDAMLTVEASAKYVLARQPVDEIIALGRKLSFDKGDDGRLIALREGKTFYTADMNKLSTYSLFRYRIAQYIDELKIEQQDLLELLSKEEQDKVIAFIKKFYFDTATDEFRKFNRFFDELAQDEELFKRFKNELGEAIPEAHADMGRYLSWIKNYLFNKYRDTNKLVLLEGNENVKVRFIPTRMGDDGKLPVDNLLQLVRAVSEDHDEVEIYVSLHGDDPTDNYVLMNVLDIIKAIPDSKITVKSIITTLDEDNRMVGTISDDTESYNISELVAATKTFLSYGKADLIVDYWEKYGSHNERIESMIYAMRHIDAGISLCNIAEIETGIDKLRTLFSDNLAFGDDDYYSRLFTIISEGVKRDYGPLLEGDSTEFIELVKWAFRKKFYQQTLTLIESRAPKDFVNKGFYYYCDDPDNIDEVINKFALIRADLKPHEGYVMEDLEHYFLKLYGRRRLDNRRVRGQKVYTQIRIDDLEEEAPEIIKAYTRCEDKDALRDLLYAYYHIGEVRNKTNHAEEGVMEDTRLIYDPNDVSYRMSLIVEGIEYFIRCFDKVNAMVEVEEGEITIINTADVRYKANALKREREIEAKKLQKKEEANKAAAKKSSVKKAPAKKTVAKKSAVSDKAPKATATKPRRRKIEPKNTEE